MVMAKINHEVLKWARVSAGLSVPDAAQKLKLSKIPDKAVERLNRLEDGGEEPARTLLSRMAKIYRRSLITLYMEKPPRKGDRGSDFRKLPKDYTEENAALVDALIRDILTRQSLMKAAIEDDEEEAEVLQFVGSKRLSDGVDSVSNSIKETIQLDISEFRRQSDPEEAFKYLRDKVEKAGVFVLLIGNLGSHHTTINSDVFRGFALADNVAPFVIVNDQDSRAAWSFTLIHELTHIWLGHTGISATESDLEVEVFCNRVAGEVLMPERDLRSLSLEDSNDFQTTLEEISDFSLLNNVSSSMIAYKLLLSGRISQQMWGRLDKRLRDLWIEANQAKRESYRDREGGPSYYTIRKHRLGKNFISQVNHLILGGSLTTVKASRILGVSPENLYKLVSTPLPSRKK